jgi:uncharacterized protein YbbK (DUF523 family)
MAEGPYLVLVSACLLGCPTAYDGGARPRVELVPLAAQGRVLPVCPEILGGLETPRSPAEIVDGDGNDVLDGRARVLAADGGDVTEVFIRGAEHTLAIVQRHGITRAILRQRSPSCGSSTIYDGTHTGRLKAGCGVTVALLRRYGVIACSEDELTQGALTRL